MNRTAPPAPTVRQGLKFPLTLWKRGLLLAALVLFAVLAALLLYGRFPWWQCILWAVLLALPIPLRLRAGERTAVWLRRLCFVLSPLFGFAMVEVLNYNDPLSSFTPLYLALNLAFYYLIAMALYLITGRAKLSACICLVLFWAVGMANRYVLTFRGRAIFPGDLLSLGTAANVASNYDYTPNALQVTTGLICLLCLLLALTIPRQRGRSKLRLRSAAPAALVSAAFAVVFFGTSFLSSMGIKPDLWTTRGDGFALHFAICLRYSTVSPPEGYSEQTLGEIVGKLADDDVSASGALTGAVQPVNLIVIMNESFSDLASVADLETNRDRMPFFHSLTENAIKGTAYSSVFGGTTANSEYEFLTGNTTAFLPLGAIPYQMYVTDGSDSLVSQLNALGYRSVASHPYYSSGWNRRAVYPYLGFSRSLFLNDFQDRKYMRGYVTDQSNYENLVRLYEEKAPGEKLFLFNVTMQNHSAYSVPWDGLPKEVWLTGDMAGRYATVDQYLSLMYQSDLALEYLVSYFSQVEEPTMILLFGDHQPQVSTNFYTDMLGHDPDLATAQKKQAVPFLLWANYDIPERDGVETSLNYLSTLLVETANLPATSYQRFLSGLQETLSAVNAMGYRTADGTWYEDADALPEAARNALLEYQMLQYNDLFEDQADRLTDFFSLKAAPS